MRSKVLSTAVTVTITDQCEKPTLCSELFDSLALILAANTPPQYTLPSALLFEDTDSNKGEKSNETWSINILLNIYHTGYIGGTVWVMRSAVELEDTVLEYVLYFSDGLGTTAAVSIIP